MKKVFLLLALGLTFAAHSQQENDRIAFYHGFDLFNSVRGGKVLGDGDRRNSPSLNYRGGAILQYHWWEAEASAEIFPTIGYYGLSLSFGVPATIPNIFGRHTDLQIVPATGVQLVIRDKDKLGDLPETSTIGESFVPEFNLKVRLDQLFGLPVYLEFDNSLKFRTDITSIWGREALPNGFFPALWEGRAFYVKVGYYIVLNTKRRPLIER